MLHVLITTSTLPLSSQDVQPRFVLDLAEGLARECQVTVLAPDAPASLKRDRWQQVDILRFSYFWPRRLQRLAYGAGMRENLRRNPLARVQTLPFIIAQTAATRQIVRKRRIEAVNSHWMVPQGLTAAIARGRRQPRFRHLLSVHAGDVYMLERSSLGREIARFILRRTDRVFADGSHVSQTLDRLVGRPVGAILQPMGAHLELFRNGPSHAPPGLRFRHGFLTFCGRFSEKKGVVYLLRAMPKVLEHHPRMGLVLIGYGPLEEELRREVSRLGLSDSVQFTGPLPHTEIGQYLRAARLAVVPSVVDSSGETDGMPTVVIEAMAAGKPVVGTEVDGIPDVIRHGENGWLCHPRDADDLAEKILIGLCHDRSPKVLSHVRTTSERFSWPEVVARYLWGLREIVAI